MAYIKNEVDYKRMKKDIDKLIKEAKTKVVKVKGKMSKTEKSLEFLKKNTREYPALAKLLLGNIK